MTQTAPPTTDGAQAQQFMLFDLGETITPPAAVEPPPQRETTPSATRSNKRSQRPTAIAGTQPTLTAPVRLDIIPILLDSIALAHLHTSTALQLYKALCGAVELWR